MKQGYLQKKPRKKQIPCSVSSIVLNWGKKKKKSNKDDFIEFIC